MRANRNLRILKDQNGTATLMLVLGIAVVMAIMPAVVAYGQYAVLHNKLQVAVDAAANAAAAELKDRMLEKVVEKTQGAITEHGISKDAESQTKYEKDMREYNDKIKEYRDDNKDEIENLQNISKPITEEEIDEIIAKKLNMDKPKESDKWQAPANSDINDWLKPGDLKGEQLSGDIKASVVRVANDYFSKNAGALKIPCKIDYVQFPIDGGLNVVDQNSIDKDFTVFVQASLKYDTGLAIIGNRTIISWAVSAPKFDDNRVFGWFK